MNARTNSRLAVVYSSSVHLYTADVRAAAEVEAEAEPRHVIAPQPDTPPLYYLYVGDVLAGPPSTTLYISPTFSSTTTN